MLSALILVPLEVLLALLHVVQTALLRLSVTLVGLLVTQSLEGQRILVYRSGGCCYRLSGLEFYLMLPVGCHSFPSYLVQIHSWVPLFEIPAS